MSIEQFNDLFKDKSMVKFVHNMDKALESRKATESEYILKLYREKKISHRKYMIKQRELERWATRERREIQKTKKQLVSGWMKAAEIISQLGKDLDYMNKIITDRKIISHSVCNTTRPVMTKND